MNLKNKYNKLFAGKPKSNDKMLTEGSVFLGIGNAKRTNLKEAENAAYYADLFDAFNEAAANLELAINDIDTQIEDDMAYDYNIKQAQVTISRYRSAVLKNLKGIEKVVRGLS